MVGRIERIARERDTCRALDRAAIDADDYELLLLWDDCVAARERGHQMRVERLTDLIAAQLGVRRK